MLETTRTPRGDFPGAALSETGRPGSIGAWVWGETPSKGRPCWQRSDGLLGLYPAPGWSFPHVRDENPGRRRGERV